jgi:hypothetical protein
MTKVALLEEATSPGETAFRAVTAHDQVMGRTAGEALDALASQLPQVEGDTLTIVRNLGPARFFTAEQRQRLELFRTANDAIGGFGLRPQRCRHIGRRVVGRHERVLRQRPAGQAIATTHRQFWTSPCHGPS